MKASSMVAYLVDKKDVRLENYWQMGAWTVEYLEQLKGKDYLSFQK